MSDFDFTVQDEGSIVVLYPQTDAASGWIDENLDADELTRWAGGVVIEHRYFDYIIDAILSEGFTADGKGLEVS